MRAGLAILYRFPGDVRTFFKQGKLRGRMVAPKSIIAQTDLVKLTGATKQAVNKAINAGRIKTKKVGKKKKVVLDDPLTELWCEQQKAKNLTPPVVNQTKKTKLADEDEQATENLTNLAIIEKKEKIKEIISKRRLNDLKLKVAREDLIEKDSVAAVLFQYLSAFNNNILDKPDMIIDTMIDKIKAGSERGELIKAMRDDLQKIIKKTKDQIKERLKKK